MNWVKKAVYGVAFTVLVFIFCGFLAEAGMPIFADGFLSVFGLALVVAMGAIEINLVTYG